MPSRLAPSTSKSRLRAALTAFAIAVVLFVALATASGCSANAPQPTDVLPTEDRKGAPLPGDGFSPGDVGDPQDTGATGDAPIVAGDETVPAPTPPSAGFAAGSSMKTTANVNLRKGPSTADAILAVVPSGTVLPLLDGAPTNAFYHVTYDGTPGWVYSAYVTLVSAPAPAGGGSGVAPGDPNGPPSVSNAIARAQASVGFSYYWGGGAWLASGPTASTAGSCSGSCPSCSHSGAYGADCSGMVAKAWELGAKDLATNSHPYATSSFVVDQPGLWTTVSRSSLQPGDAMVYNSGGSGHIVLWESGDGWGASTVYECKGCSYGCVHDTRTFTSSYHGIRRAGF